MVTGILNPIADPIGFIIFFFLLEMNESGFITLFKLGLLCSVIAFPFVLLGRLVLSWLDENLRSGKGLLHYYLTGLIITVLFWFLLRLWYVVFGGSVFAAGSALSIIGSLLLSSIILFPMVLFGIWLKSVVQQHWKMPELLTIYIITLVLSTLLWFVIWLLLLIGISSYYTPVY